MTATTEDLRERLARMEERICDVPRVHRSKFAALLEASRALLDEATPATDEAER